MARFQRTALALMAAAVIVGACGSSGGGTSAATSAAATTAAAAAAGGNTIDVTGRSFPTNFDVAKGTKLTWNNKSNEAHTVSSGTRPTADGKFESGNLAAGASFSFTFTDAGTFSYFCKYHNGMQGTITVK